MSPWTERRRSGQFERTPFAENGMIMVVAEDASIHDTEAEWIIKQFCLTVFVAICAVFRPSLGDLEKIEPHAEDPAGVLYVAPLCLDPWGHPEASGVILGHTGLYGAKSLLG